MFSISHREIIIYFILNSAIYCNPASVYDCEMHKLNTPSHSAGSY